MGYIQQGKKYLKQAVEMIDSNNSVEISSLKKRLQLEADTGLSPHYTSNKVMKLPAIPTDWHQSTSHVIISILVKNLDPNQTHIVFTNSEMLEGILVDTNDCIHLISFELFNTIDPTQSSFNITSMKIEISLTKSTPGMNWSSLNKLASPTKPIPIPITTTTTTNTTLPVPVSTTTTTTTSKPPNPYASKKDWNKIAKEVETEEEKPTGDAALHALFQQIYRDADEDTRRAMVKSYQTSGGTVLTTNWKEAKAKDYEKELHKKQ
jgi:hypothetical protein